MAYPAMPSARRSCLPETKSMFVAIPQTSDPSTSSQDDGMPSQPEKTIQDLINVFKLLADETRLKILFYLQQTEELNVRALCKLLRQRQPAVSHHLALLREAGLIDMRRDGKHNFYRLIPSQIEQLVATYFGSTPGQPGRLCFDGFELRYCPLP